ncbi:MaoC/PaaZ C-terminal domain-containing protein [Bacillus sp. S/N-304-OC-R1]|uniref:MaoC/PaaZ C-terminal domain-containing protein n=1 Tax=Bacillus sp. S/N-304-OC-R1 TaxID=2758034 RepID=UPI001C8E82D2|nr:MaoC/PaaZ C-terminal domain-containing protein [Bacillus sp. S/N-304-OC-R1]MBY0121433.1 MaoC family dehydratase N-terminal domain-containing protein [Bacillus sp. S/N-304-OC-R1]
MKSVTFKITQQDIEQYALLSGDFNPIHLDKEAANSHGFPDKIAHGMMTMAKVWSVISQEATLSHSVPLIYDMTFSAPVYINDEVTITFMEQYPTLRYEGKCKSKIVAKGKIILNEK